MKEYIKLHVDGLFTEDELCKAFKMTHIKWRHDHPTPPVLLSAGAMAEIRMSDDHNIARIARQYKTSTIQANRAIWNIPNKIAHLDEIQAHNNVGMSKEDIARNMGISLNKVKKALSKKRDASYGDQVRTLLATGLYTQAELADEMNVSQSTVSYYAEEGIKRPNKPRIGYDKWAALIAEYKTGHITVTELSRKYKTSRATIYNRIKLL